MKNGVRTKIISLKAVKLSGGAFTAAAILLSFAPTELTAQPSSGSYSQEKLFQLSPDGKTLIKYNGKASEVVIPQGITKIGYRAFSGKYALTRVVIPESVTEIAQSAFSFCRSLREINLPAGLKKIETWAFNSCESLRPITIPAKVEEIGDGAFAGVKAIGVARTNKNFYIDDYGVLIDRRKNAVLYCPPSVKSYTVSENVTAINNGAFFYCTNLARLTIHTNVSRIGSFVGCPNLTEIDVAADNPRYYTDNQGCLFGRNTKLLVFCPSTLKEYTVPEGIRIDMNAFKNCYNLTRVTVPDSVKLIPFGAFARCRKLTTAVIGKNTKIGQSAFPKNCKIIRREPGQLQAVASEANTETEQKVSFKSISETPRKDFQLSPDGKTLIKYTGKSAEVIIPTGVTVIGAEAFANCQTLAKVTISDGVTHIYASAFANCINLKQVSFPDSVVQIRRFSFSGCTSLKSLILPADLTSLGRGAFTGVKAVYVSGKNKHFYVGPAGEIINSRGKQIVYCRTSTSGDYTVPDGIKSILAYSFQNCRNITSIKLPDGIKTLGQSAFQDCTNLRSITIPDSVSVIGAGAFSGCSSLKRLNLPGKIKIGQDAFPPTCKIICR